MALKVSGIGIIAGFLLMIGVFAYFRKDLPNLRDISGTNIGGSIRYYDRTGQTLLWEDFDAVKRIPVNDDQMSQFVKDATVALEDKDFFRHGGFDVRGIARASLNNVIGSDSKQGGSTITQQLVRLTQPDVGREQTYKRKVKELILSIELERSYSKKEILTGYLNTAPYGNVQYGVETATRDYFQKSAKELTLDEAAFLAAIPKSPSFYSPYGPRYNAKALVGRQHYTLDLMEQQGMITSQQRDEAKKVDTLAKVHEVKPKFEGMKAPYFVLIAKQQLEEKYGAKNVKRGGWKVTTTLDLNLQNIAEAQVKKGYGNVTRAGFDEVAFAAEDVTNGQMVAIVGGVDFYNKDHGENNYAHWRLPPGSSFKPYDYLSLIENTNDFGAGSVLYDTQGPIDGYPCKNKAQPKQGGDCLWDYDFRYPGPMTLRYALGGSRNVPAIKAMLIAGVDKTIETAEKLGMPSGYKCYKPGIEDVQFAQEEDEAPCYASSAIGDGAYLYLDEHVHSYATLSRNGKNLPQTYLLKIEDAGNKVLYEWKQEKGEQAVRPESAYIVADMMADPNASYFTNKPHRYKDWKFSLKTGTTNDSKDGWLMGFSTRYSAGVWVGHHTRRVATRSFMETMTQPIWQGWMNEVHSNIKAEERERPSGIKTLPAYIVRTHVGLGSREPSPSTDLFPSWFQQKKNTTGSKRTIDVVSNKLATDCTPERAKKEVTDADAANFSGDRFVSGTQTGSASESDDIHKCDDLKPGIRLTITGSNGHYHFSADVTQGTHPLSSEQYPGTVNFRVDGQTVRSFSVDSSGIVGMDYDADFDGTKQVVAEVIDSVLYDATDTGTISDSTGGGGGGDASVITLSVASLGSGNYKFNWNTIATATSYQICIDNNITPSFVCTTGSPGDVRPVAGSGRKAYIISNNGIQSSTENF